MLNGQCCIPTRQGRKNRTLSVEPQCVDKTDALVPGGSHDFAMCRMCHRVLSSMRTDKSGVLSTRIIPGGSATTQRVWTH